MKSQKSREIMELVMGAIMVLAWMAMVLFA
jgi:hypothetical protein